MSLLGRGLLYMSLTGLIGGASIRLVLLRHRDPGVRLNRFMAFLAMAGILALSLLGIGQFSAFRDPFAPWQEDALMLLTTPWGRRWILASAGFVVLLVLVLWQGVGVATLLLPFALALYPPLTGHAAASGDWTAAALTADWIHLVAAGSWLGALSGLLYLGRHASEKPLIHALARFSLQARWSVAALLLTGSFASWLHLTGPGDVVGSPWGRILGLKLLLVAGMMALGAWNWRRLTPGLAEEGGRSALIRASWVEVFLGMLVLITTAVLTGTAPPESMP
ncbi:MAG: CopD family protein [Gemmatimonadota bacterium]